MDVIDLAAIGVIIVASLFFLTAVIALFAAVQNMEIRENFCESEGFDGHDMGDKYHIGYCYKTQGENAEIKNFFCKPSPNIITPIGKCKFLEAK